MEKLRVVSTFSGAGMQERGIELTGLYDLNVVGTCEIDIWATLAYAAIHNGLTNQMVEEYPYYPSKQEMIDKLVELNIGYDPMKDKKYDWQKKINSKDKLVEKTWMACVLNKNFGDISKVDALPTCDLLTWSSPCTDISVAGKIRGFDQDSKTRSSMLWHIIRLLRNYKERNNLPKFLLFENVKNIVSKRFIDNFNEVIGCLEDIGYNSYWQVMNAKEVGVPQNRPRVFMISIRKDIDNGKFEFPIPFDSGVRLKDVLEPHVDDKYYITTVKAQQLIDDLILNGTLTDENINELKCLGNLTPVDNEKIHQRNWVYDENGVVCTTTATMYKDPPRVLQRNENE